MKVTLKNVLQDVTWAELEKRILSIYPEEDDSLDLYKRLYWDLYNLTPIVNQTGAMIEFELFNEDEEIFYDENDIEYIDADSFEVGMSLDRWKIYLGYYIPDELFEQISKAEIITHAFIEASYGGFTESFTPSKNDE